ncbi:MAG: hypothetical protein MK193_06430 [Lentisphaeria bacterium]|nr:hypothetical protein [Lentisphaeria bacterium]
MKKLLLLLLCAQVFATPVPTFSVDDKEGKLSYNWMGLSPVDSKTLIQRVKNIAKIHKGATFKIDILPNVKLIDMGKILPVINGVELNYYYNFWGEEDAYYDIYMASEPKLPGGYIMMQLDQKAEDLEQSLIVRAEGQKINCVLVADNKITSKEFSLLLPIIKKHDLNYYLMIPDDTNEALFKISKVQAIAEEVLVQEDKASDLEK